jgi:hypothetical protein
MTIADDDLPPLSVTAVSPTGSAVPRASVVSATLSRGVPQANVSLTLMAGKKAVKGTTTCNSTTACTTATFVPAPALGRSTTYTASFRATDGTTTVSSTWSFTTGK